MDMKQKALKFLTIAKILLSLLYTVGIFLIIAILRGFELDGWFWIAVILFYAIFLPVYISGMVILFLLRKKFKTAEPAPKENGKLGKLRLSAILCGIVGILGAPLALTLSALSAANAAEIALLFSITGAAAALILAITDLIIRRIKTKKSNPT